MGNLSREANEAELVIATLVKELAATDSRWFQEALVSQASRLIFALPDKTELHIKTDGPIFRTETLKEFAAQDKLYEPVDIREINLHIGVLYKRRADDKPGLGGQFVLQSVAEGFT